MKKLSKKTTESMKKWFGDYEQHNKRNTIPEDIKKELVEYYDSGYGFKRIAKQLNTSYTKCRRLFLIFLEHKCRTGRSVVTEPLRERRKELATEIGRFKNWPEKYPHIHKNSRTGLQGYYQKTNGDWIWLRSCWEYIYAKWLDKNKKNWKYEVRQYKINGKSYRPDFFIYDNQENISEIIEIKSSYFNEATDRINKALDTKKEHNLPIILITDIKPYIQKDRSYMKELREWKRIRKSKAELEK